MMNIFKKRNKKEMQGNQGGYELLKLVDIENEIY